ncbi:MAG: hypothetical protein ABSG86_08710 [Thermoguttaceae bacterium]|jgi:peptidoglycan/xylan/chitin deacetylase (PgdA/CDA1 family)
MRVFFTVDVETYTGDYGADIRGNGQGLGYLLAMCGKYGVAGTFFVEALGALRWGDDGVREIIDLIRSSGQEVQLHLHPEVLYPQRPGIQMSKLPLTEQVDLLGKGVAVLQRCGVGSVGAFRAGDLAANETTLIAMRQVGIPVSSNRDLDTKSSVQSAVNQSFPIHNDIAVQDGVTDLPVTGLRSPLSWLDGTWRHLQVCALSGREMTNALDTLEGAGYTCATILTHPPEYFAHTSRFAARAGRNRRRLERLFQHIAGRPSLESIFVSGCTALEIPTRSPPACRYRLRDSLGRLREQLFGRIGL